MNIFFACEKSNFARIFQRLAHKGGSAGIGALKILALPKKGGGLTPAKIL